jgi:general stress protein 26
MGGPTTTRDHRFSGPGTRATSWEETRSILEGAQLFWITTVRADGRPHVAPLVAVWLGDAIYFCTGPAEQKAVNLRGNARVILTTGCNTWDNGVDVVVEGEAVRVTDAALLKRLAEQWALKWDGRWRWEVHDDGFRHPGGGAALVYAIAPAKILAFAKGHFSLTRHRF